MAWVLLPPFSMPDPSPLALMLAKIDGVTANSPDVPPADGSVSFGTMYEAASFAQWNYGSNCYRVEFREDNPLLAAMRAGL